MTVVGDKVMVCDRNNCVMVYMKELKYVRQFASHGDRSRQVSSRLDISSDQHGNLYIADILIWTSLISMSSVIVEHQPKLCCLHAENHSGHTARREEVCMHKLFLLWVSVLTSLHSSYAYYTHIICIYSYVLATGASIIATESS